MKTPGARSAVTAALALLGLVLVAQPGLALAAGGGHGGGGHGGGGHAAGGHFGGGAHFGGAPHFGGGGHFAGAGRVGGGAHFGGASHFAAPSRFGGAAFGGHAFVGHAYGGGAHFAAPARAGGFARARTPIGYGRFGHGRPLGFVARGYHWGGGYWRGRYWPPIYWGVNVAWFLPVLPAYCPVYWWGGVPYYYYDTAYYTWDPSESGYIATAPPPAIDDSQDAQDSGPPPVDDQGADQGAPPPVDDQGAPEDEQSAAPPPGSDNLYAYPKNGQSDQQQAQDKLACEQWAAAQTGSGAAATSAATAQDGSIDYRRALVACLTGRGYSVD